MIIKIIQTNCRFKIILLSAALTSPAKFKALTERIKSHCYGRKHTDNILLCRSDK